jgi:hypothetical protein
LVESAGQMKRTHSRLKQAIHHNVDQHLLTDMMEWCNWDEHDHLSVLRDSAIKGHYVMRKHSSR